MMKNHVILDNRHVIPYNPNLLIKYQAHINIEWCNQTTLVKYLFKYNKKGYDRITATIVPTDSDGISGDKSDMCLQVKHVGEFVSIPIHGRTPVVKRLFSHLQG